MAFNGKDGEFISIGEAASMTQAWRNGENGDIKAVLYGKDKLQEMLDQDGTTGIRMYFAENSDGEKTLVLVSSDADGNDLVDGLILEHGTPCPKFCSAGNPING